MTTFLEIERRSSIDSRLLEISTTTDKHRGRMKVKDGSTSSSCVARISLLIRVKKSQLFAIEEHRYPTPNRVHVTLKSKFNFFFASSGKEKGSLHRRIIGIAEPRLVAIIVNRRCKGEPVTRIRDTWFERDSNVFYGWKSCCVLDESDVRVFPPKETLIDDDETKVPFAVAREAISTNQPCYHKKQFARSICLKAYYNAVTVPIYSTSLWIIKRLERRGTKNVLHCHGSRR